MKAATEHFNFIYKGELVDDHTINTNDLGVALLSIGNVFAESNKIVGKEKAKVHTKVRALSGGSFDIQIIVESANIADIFSQDTWNAIQEIKNLLFGDQSIGLLGAAGVTIGGTIGLIKLIRLFRGERLSKGGKITISTEDGGMTEYTPTEAEVEGFNSSRLRKDIDGVVSPVGKDGMDGLLITSQAKEGLAWIPHEDVQHFVYQPSRTPFNEKILHERLRIISPVFKENAKWRLENVDTQVVITAYIRDEDFLKKIDTHEISFRKDDILGCDVKIIQYETNKAISNEYYVMKVKYHNHQTDHQLQLPTDN